MLVLRNMYNFFSAMLIQFAFIKQFTRFSAKKWLLHEELINSRFRGEDEEEEGHRVLDEGVEEDLFATLLRSSDGIKRVLRMEDHQSRS